jgi:hypothetical protein
MRRNWLFISLAGALALAPLGPGPDAQAGGGTLIFVSRRPPRELSSNIRGWASSNSVRAYNEDTTSHVWRIQFMAFLNRDPPSSTVNLSFYHVERDRARTRRYVYNEDVTLSNPPQRIFYHNTVLHRQAGQFDPMEEYDVSITYADARGNHELARGRVGLVGQVERHDGVIDFTNPNTPQVR